MGDDRGFWGRQMAEDAFLKMNPAVMWDELRGRGPAGRGTAPLHELVGVVRRGLVLQSSRLAGAKEKEEVGLQKRQWKASLECSARTCQRPCRSTQKERMQAEKAGNWG